MLDLVPDKAKRKQNEIIGYTQSYDFAKFAHREIKSKTCSYPTKFHGHQKKEKLVSKKNNFLNCEKNLKICKEYLIFLPIFQQT